ncbi:MAG TPA: transposase [Casimicrobiaceae bacterium]|nr:transposase [Casimicrobiaceae bacterium]
MDTCAEAVATDALGRRTGPRQRHTIEQKRQIVEETHVRGASVATVARRHQVNANQVFTWRQLYRQGLLEEKSAGAAGAMLPVKVTTPTVLPTEHPRERSTGKAKHSCSTGCIEIELPSGVCLRVHGAVDRRVLGSVVKLLVRA